MVLIIALRYLKVFEYISVSVVLPDECGHLLTIRNMFVAIKR